LGDRLRPVVLERIESLGFAVFDNGEYDLNLFGIRCKNRTANSFDDVIGCAYKDLSGWKVRYWPATTDPGTINGKLATKNPKGAAILAPGQYRGAYRIGLHGSTKYAALVQTGGPVSVFRDDTGDNRLDFDKSTIESGYFGINIHASSMHPYRDEKTTELVKSWSEGCQVHATTSGFRDMMNLCHKQIETHPSWVSFTYTLLEQWW
jgi:hypothetical protein